MQNFDTRISVTKALCIILMVVGHSGCPQAINDFFWTYTYALFFLCVGLPAKRKIFKYNDDIFQTQN